MSFPILLDNTPFYLSNYLANMPRAHGRRSITGRRERDLNTGERRVTRQQILHISENTYDSTTVLLLWPRGMLKFLSIEAEDLES